jgi:hypothetical protein
MTGLISMLKTNFSIPRFNFIEVIRSPDRYAPAAFKGLDHDGFLLGGVYFICNFVGVEEVLIGFEMGEAVLDEKNSVDNGH